MTNEQMWKAVSLYKDLALKSKRMEELALELMAHPDVTPEMLWEAAEKMRNTREGMRKAKESMVNAKIPERYWRHL